MWWPLRHVAALWGSLQRVTVDRFRSKLVFCLNLYLMSWDYFLEKEGLHFADRSVSGDWRGVAQEISAGKNSGACYPSCTVLTGRVWLNYQFSWVWKNLERGQRANRLCINQQDKLFSGKGEHPDIWNHPTRGTYLWERRKLITAATTWMARARTKDPWLLTNDDWPGIH